MAGRTTTTGTDQSAIGARSRCGRSSRFGLKMVGAVRAAPNGGVESHMGLERRAGVVVGTSFTHMVGSAFANFGSAPLFGEPGFLVNAAAHAPQIGLSAVVGIAFGAVFAATGSHSSCCAPTVRRRRCGCC
jgi:hypothetical protein